jgi:hypothetical protein
LKTASEDDKGTTTTKKMQKLLQNVEEKKDDTSFTNIIDFIRNCEIIGASLNPQQKHYMVQRLKENSE